MSSCGCSRGKDNFACLCWLFSFLRQGEGDQVIDRPQDGVRGCHTVLESLLEQPGEPRTAPNLSQPSSKWRVVDGRGEAATNAPTRLLSSHFKDGLLQNVDWAHATVLYTIALRKILGCVHQKQALLGFICRNVADAFAFRSAMSLAGVAYLLAFVLPSGGVAVKLGHRVR